MNRCLSFTLLVLTLMPSSFANAQNSSDLKPQQMVDQWFTSLNALDDGKTPEENSAAVDRFVRLHDDGAYFQVGPSESQLGPVVYHGSEAIRKWAIDFSQAYSDLQYRIDFRTFGENTVQLFYASPTPGGGIGVSVEFTAVYADQNDKRRMFGPGAAFFLFDKAGKIQNVRLYLLRDELMEVSR
jgi:hypothetical protein